MQAIGAYPKRLKLSKIKREVSMQRSIHLEKRYVGEGK
jgi:hypothetical protein